MDTEMYKGVQIIYDADHDERVKILIDNMTEIDRRLLTKVEERKGCVVMTWRQIPTHWKGLPFIDIPDKDMGEGYGDTWSIENEKDYTEVTIPSRVISRQMRYLILKEQKWKCNSCHDTLTFSNKSSWQGEKCHIDHIHPFSDRYSYANGADLINERSNLQALCHKCNLEKYKHRG